MVIGRIRKHAPLCTGQASLGRKDGPEADGETRGVQLILALPSSAFHSLLPKSIGIASQSSVNT